jgi:hypothetical protein
MKKTIIYLSMLWLFFISIACEKTIEIDLEDAKIRIVVNAELNPDSTISVHVTRSRHILDNAAIVPLADATVKLYEDDVLIGNLTYRSGGFYDINYKPIVGRIYKIEVIHSDFDDVFALTTIPESIAITGIDTTKSYDEYGGQIYNFSISFNDPASEKNYYMIGMRNRYSYEAWDPNMIIYDTLYVGPDTTIVHIEYGGYYWTEMTDKLYFNTDDMIIDEMIYYNNTAVFSDELINGKSYSVKLRVDAYGFYSDTNMVFIDLYAISPEYYKYLTSFAKHQNATGDPFAEPVMVFSNVVEGIGIVGSAAANTDSLQVSGGGGYIHYE